MFLPLVLCLKKKKKKAHFHVPRLCVPLYSVCVCVCVCVRPPAGPAAVTGSRLASPQLTAAPGFRCAGGGGGE